MSKILMVCLGNICRSPLAHGILSQKASIANLPIRVDSAGTGSWHVGSAPDPEVLQPQKNMELTSVSKKLDNLTLMILMNLITFMSWINPT